MNSSLSLSTPDTFPIFPYDEPYDIQLDLMQHLYNAIEDKAVAVVESPTGTGKTASILGATISWLLDDHERAKKGYLTDRLVTNDPSDWVAVQTLNRRRRDLEAEEAECRERLLRARRREEAMKRIANGRVVKRQKLTHPDGKYPPDEDAFLPEDSTEQVSDSENIDPKVKALMQRLAHHNTSKTNVEEPTCTKVYYSSRTHSQLAQVIRELCNLRISTTMSQADGQEDEHSSPVRVVSLGSRKQLCINKPLVDSGGDLDEKCRELLAGKSGAGCGFLPPRESETQLLEFRDQILAVPKDIEDLATSGKLANICPYFSSRKAIRQAQLVALPYNLLLSSIARKALGIDVTNQIIVIDEAHNLVSTLLSLSSVVLDASTIRVSVSQLDAYLSKFRLRLSHAHLLHLQKLRASLNGVQQFVLEWERARSGQGVVNSRVTEVVSAREFVGRMGKNIEGINFLEIRSYLENSKIARKIASYSEDKNKKGVTPPLHTVEAFLLALASPSDGEVLTDGMDQDRTEIKYQQLNPASHFRELVDASRCVILAGGTMSPIPALTNQLFPNVNADRIRPFSCGHIVPPSNVLAVVVQKGPRGGQMEFKFQNREDQTLFCELGQLLLNLVNVVPAGMVVFFPSYSVLNTGRRLWMSDKTLEKIGLRKKVFYEPMETTEVESVLRDYGKEIQQPRGSCKSNGALLMAVVGAKLSEGLNFTDDLARAVVMVGLPYPNASSPELKERLEYVSNLSKQKGEKEDAGKELYENLCMNAVNQSIGRAIRHQKDWASLVLVDTRYSSPRIQRKLPGWIFSGAKITSTFGATMKTLGEFYKSKR